VIRLPIKQDRKPVDPPPEEEAFPPGSQFEYSRWGEKIMVWPRTEVWVVDCKTGKPIRREGAVPFMRDGKDRFFWIKKGEPKPETDLLYPSVWAENR
jgi:hypothetical protein